MWDMSEISRKLYSAGSFRYDNEYALLPFFLPLVPAATTEESQPYFAYKNWHDYSPWLFSGFLVFTFIEASGNKMQGARMKWVSRV